MRTVIATLRQQDHPHMASTLRRREAIRIFEAVVWRQALLAQTPWIELIFGMILSDDLTVWRKSESFRQPEMALRPAFQSRVTGRSQTVPGPGDAVESAQAIPSAVFGFLIAFFQSAQFQTLVRTALKMGGLWLYLHTVPIADQTAAAQLEFINQVIGGGLIAWGLILSVIVHAGHGNAATGTSRGPISTSQLNR